MSAKRQQVVVRTGPKRKIERIAAAGDQQGSTSVAYVDLHTAEDAKTLVSLRARIGFQPNYASTASATYMCYWAIMVRPNGTAVYTLSNGDIADQDVPMQLIARGHTQMIQQYNGSSALSYVQVDPPMDVVTKAMRKLKVGDKISLAYILGSSTGAYIAYSVDMHFKE